MLAQEIRTRLLALGDPGYRAFQSKLMPGVDLDRVIGVRMPVLRQLAREYAAHPQLEGFLGALPHAFYDEDNLHGLLLERVRDYDEAVTRLDAFLPHVDNWATCDLLKPRALAANRARLPEDIERWLASGATYTVRFGIGMAMTHFLDEDFDPRWLGRVAAIGSQEYYVNMMRAWFFATALTKQWRAALPFVEDRRLDAWTHRKTIQKACESRLLAPEQKSLLRSLR